jgi:hypothetical protein
MTRPFNEPGAHDLDAIAGGEFLDDRIREQDEERSETEALREVGQAEERPGGLAQ